MKSLMFLWFFFSRPSTLFVPYNQTSGSLSVLLLYVIAKHMPEIPDFWIIFPNYLHSLSLNDGVEEFVVLCHLLRSYNFWLTGVTFVVIQ